jgi:hypothetical protein
MSPHRDPGPGARTTRRVAAGLATAVLTLSLPAGAALLAACGGSSGGPAGTPQASASAAPAPVPSPQVTSGRPPAAAVETVRDFWTLVGAGRLEDAQRSLVAPGSPILQWSGGDIASAHFVRVVPRSVSRGPADGATVEFAAVVWIEPAPGVSPWGDPGEHQLFEHVVRMSDGTWRMWDSGTGP